MATTNTALEIISSANLSPTEHLLLNHFIEGAVDSELAARYLISTIGQGTQHDTEIRLRHFKQDWRKLVTRLTTFDLISKRLDALVRRRDGPRCTMTKVRHGSLVSTVEPAYILPPSMLHNLESAEEGGLFKILEAYLSPLYVAQLRTQLLSHNGDDEASLQNLWLLSPSMHRAFRTGYVNVRPGSQPPGDTKAESELDGEIQDAEYVLETLYPEECSGLFLGDGTKLQSRIRFKIFTSDAKMLRPPSSFFFEIHYRFATALHLFSIEDKVARGWPQPRRGFAVPFVRQAFYCLWLCIPLWARLQCYLLLMRIGSRLYGTKMVPWVQRVPFGLIIKQCIRSPQNEPNSLRLVEQHTSIPAPGIVDVGEYGGTTYLVMTRLCGQMLDDVLHLMSYAERDRFADELGSYVAQLRRIPNRTPYLFCNMLGGPLVDHRIPDGSAGPFHTESDFNNHLTSHLGCPAAEVVGEQNLRQDHRSYFTHSDFHCTNLLVDRGRLSGIVDWECAGYKPEYWEFTKAMYSARRDPVLEGIFRRAFRHDYESELKVERELWRWTPFGV